MMILSEIINVVYLIIIIFRNIVIFLILYLLFRRFINTQWL